MPPVECAGCGNAFDNEGPEAPYECDKCEKSFCNDCWMKFHEDSTEMETIYCPQCTKEDQIENPSEYEWQATVTLSDEEVVMNKSGLVMAVCGNPTFARKVAQDHNDMLKARKLMFDIKRLWDIEGFGSNENLSGPLYERLTELLS